MNIIFLLQKFQNIIFLVIVLFYFRSVMNIPGVLTFITLCDISSIISLFNLKSIHEGIYFHCNNATMLALIGRQFALNDIQISAHIIGSDSNIVQYSHKKIGLIVDSTCENWENMVSNKTFKSPFTWIIYSKNVSKVAETMKYFPIEFDSDITLISADDYVVYEFYKFGASAQNGYAILNKIGYTDSILPFTNKRSKNLTGVRLRMSVVYTDPIVNDTFEHFLNQQNTKRLQIDSVHKLKFYRVMMYLRDMYNFTYELQRTNSWGYLSGTSFDGVVGALQRKETDIGSSAFFRKDRFAFVDYPAETWSSRICFIFRHPKHPGGFYAIYIRPFVGIVWFCTMGLLVLIAVCLFVLLNSDMVTYKDTSISLAVIFVFAALGQQGMSIPRKSTSLKILTLATFVFTLTLYQYYNAMIVSTLLRESPKTIRTLNELLQSKLHVGADDVIYNKDYFERSSDPVIIALYNSKVKTDSGYNFFPPDKGMSLVKAGGFAFHLDTIIAYPAMRRTFTESELCEAQEVYMIPQQKLGPLIQKRSQYRDHIAFGIRRMFEHGIMNRLKSVWDEPRPPCIRTPDTSVFSVSIYEFSMALVILSVGAVMSLFILICEIIAFNLKVKYYEFVL